LQVNGGRKKVLYRRTTERRDGQRILKFGAAPVRQTERLLTDENDFFDFVLKFAMKNEIVTTTSDRITRLYLTSQFSE
jgi:hypothetical protein